MVGDWAYIKEDPMKYELKQVKPEHFVRSLCWFKPVPITDDILEKNGFVYTKQKRWISEADEKRINAIRTELEKDPEESANA